MQRLHDPAIAVAGREADRVTKLQRYEGRHAFGLVPDTSVGTRSTQTVLACLTGALQSSLWHNCNCTLQSSTACCPTKLPYISQLQARAELCKNSIRQSVELILGAKRVNGFGDDG